MSSLTRKTLRRKPVNSHYDSYQAFCYAVKTAVLANFERRTGGGSETQFLPNGSAQLILDDRLLSCLLRFAKSSGEIGSRTTQVTENEQIRRIKSRKLQDLLALLLFISCSQTAMQAAIADLVLIDDTAWEEENEFRRKESRRELGVLPLTKREAERIFGREDTVTPAFIDIHQACFCPIVFRENEATDLEDVTYRRFPYLEEEPLGEGSMGEVFRVKVAPGHFISSKGEGGDTDELPRDLARKDYKLNREDREEREEEKRPRGGRRIRDEKDILKLLHDCRNHGHIVKTLGAFHNGVRYSLFLELAARDLNKYLHDRNEKLTSPAAKSDFLKCAADLTSALVWLHEGIKIENYDKCICYHLDLKPHNILVFLKGSGESESGEKDMVWKLSDFGEAVLKMSTTEELTGPRKFFSFKKPNSDFSHTLNTRLEGSFLAPESRNKRGMGTHSDVWSWGCIVSILFAFLEHGSQGVDEYEEIRLKDRDVKKSDQFFRPPLTWTAPKINTKVEEYHGQLIQAAEGRDPVEGRAVKHFLDFLVDEVFVINWKDRTTARRMEEELRKVRDCYLSQAEGRASNIDQPSVPLLTQSWNYVRNMLPTILKPEPQDTDAGQDGHTIPDYKYVKASAISPCGRIIAFWSDAYIRLYTSDMLPDSSRSLLTTRGEDYKLEGASSFWNSIDITWKYVVASTSNNTFDCYIFKLQDAQTVGISMEKSFRALIQLPEIRRVALSPKSEWFACVVSRKGDARLPGSIKYARMEDILKVAKPGRFALEDELNSPSPDSIAWETVDMIYPAADLMSICISDANIIYAVVLPYSNIINNEHQIILHSLDLEKRELHTTRLRSTPLEYSTASFFTAFTPFRKTNACAIVTRENRLQIHYFSEEEEDLGDCIQSIENFRLLEIVMDFNDEKIFALGTETANHQVWLLSFGVPTSNDLRIAIKKEQKLSNIWYNDDCKLSLSKEDRTKHVLISSARGVIYRHKLSSPRA